MNKTFQTQRKIKFHEADPAGIVFFANILTMAHETFEQFIQATGLSWQEWFNPKDFYVPIKHVECDYQIPFLAGQEYLIEAEVCKISESSFQMHYLFKQNQNLHAEVFMVHVFIDAKNKNKISLPESIATRLKPFHNPSK